MLLSSKGGYMSKKKAALLRSFADSEAVRENLHEEIYEAFLRAEHLQSAQFKFLLAALIQAHQILLQDPESERAKQSFLEAKNAMKVHCMEKAFFECYVQYYQEKKLPLVPKALRLIEKPNEPKAISWDLWLFLLQFLMLYLVTLGQAPIVAARTAKSKDKTLEEAEALILKELGPQPYSENTALFNEKNFLIGEKDLPFTQNLISIQEALSSKKMEKGPFNGDWKNFQPKEFHEISELLKQLKISIKEALNLLKKLPDNPEKLELEKEIQKAKALFQSYHEFPKVEFFTELGIQIPPQVMSPELKGNFSKALCKLDRKNSAKIYQFSKEWASKGHALSSYFLYKNLIDSENVTAFNKTLAELFLKMAIIQTEDPLHLFAFNVEKTRNLIMTFPSLFLELAFHPRNYKILFSLIKVLTLAYGIIKLSTSLYRNRPRVEEVQEESQLKEEEAKRNKEEKKKLKMAERAKRLEETQAGARAAEEERAKKSEEKIKEIEHKKYDHSVQAFEKLRCIIWKFEKLESELSKRANPVLISLEELKEKRRAISPATTPEEGIKRNHAIDESNKKIQACEKYLRSLQTLASKASEFIKLAQSDALHLPLEKFITHINHLEELKSILNEDHKLQKNIAQAYTEMKGILKKKTETKDAPTAVQNATPKKSKKSPPPSELKAPAEVADRVEPAQRAAEPATLNTPTKKSSFPISKPPSAFFKYQKPQQPQVDSFYKRDSSPEEKKKIAEEAAELRLGWMYWLVKDHLSGFEVFINKKIEHPLVLKYGLLYNLHEFNLLLLAAYTRRAEFNTPALFCSAEIGEFVHNFWNLLIHRHYAVNVKQLLDCVTQYYHPDYFLKFDSSHSAKVYNTSLYRTLSETQELRTPYQLVIDLENAFKDLQNLESFVKTEGDREIPEYIAACRMILMIIRKISRELDKIPGILSVSSRRDFLSFLGFLKKCESLGSKDRHEVKLDELKNYLAHGVLVRIDKVPAWDIKSLAYDGRQIWHYREESKVFEILKARIHKLAEEAKLREIGTSTLPLTTLK